jgi:hypothetical protein
MRTDGERLLYMLIQLKINGRKPKEDQAESGKIK